MRATFRLSSPPWFAQPSSTSSTSLAGTPFRASNARSGTAARSSGRSPASCPPTRPMGVRTASMIHASVMRASSQLQRDADDPFLVRPGQGEALEPLGQLEHRVVPLEDVPRELLRAAAAAVLDGLA